MLFRSDRASGESLSDPIEVGGAGNHPRSLPRESEPGLPIFGVHHFARVTQMPLPSKWTEFALPESQVEPESLVTW